MRAIGEWDKDELMLKNWLLYLCSFCKVIVNQLGYPSLLGIFIVSSVSLFLCLNVSPLYLSIFLFLPSISLSFNFSHLSLYIFPLSLLSIILCLSSISLSQSLSIHLAPPPPLSFKIIKSLLQVRFPALDPSLATPHLYSRQI